MSRECHVEVAFHPCQGLTCCLHETNIARLAASGGCFLREVGVMVTRSTLLKALLRERHWQKYGTFCKEYDIAARKADAALVGTWPSRGQYARWLAGDLKGLPQPDHCRVLVTMFPGLTAAQLFSPMDSGLIVGLGAEVERRQGDRGLPSTGQAATSPLGSDVPSGESTGGAVSARYAGTLSEEISMATEDAARFVRQAHGAVDQDVIDQLDADVRQFAIEYLSKPPYALFRPLSRLRSEVFAMLEEHQRPRVLPDLYRIGGRLCALLAHAAADLGQTYAAETDTRAAWLCADLAEDDALRAYVRWIQSNVAYWDGDYRRAAELAHSGQRYATAGTTLLRLASQEARAHAAAHDDRAVERALAMATAARDRPASPAEMPGVFRFEPGKAAYYASEVRLALGGRDNYQRAAGDAEEALDLFNAVPEAARCPEFVAAAQLDLVTAHLALDDLDGAEQHLRSVLGLPVESRTLPVVRRVAKVGTVVDSPRYARSMLAAELGEQINLFCAYTATREVPELPQSPHVP